MLVQLLQASGVFAYSMDWKVNKFNTISSKGHADLDAKLFANLVDGDRNYTAVVLLTTTAAEHQCAPCAEYAKEFSLLSYSWSRTFENGKLYFGTLDYKNGIEVFQKVVDSDR
jgi:oligosaccharyltransferase complex subunit gamma